MNHYQAARTVIGARHKISYKYHYAAYNNVNSYIHLFVS